MSEGEYTKLSEGIKLSLVLHKVVNVRHFVKTDLSKQ